MNEVLWFRRDLRITDNAILKYAKKNVLPIFIFDKNILNKLPSNNKRITFLYNSVLKLKEELKLIGLDLAVFYSTPKDVFIELKKKGFDKVLTSIDFEYYSKKTNEEVSKIIYLEKYIDSFILNPSEHLKKDKTPYKMFTPFYKSLYSIWSSNKIEEYQRNNTLKKIDFDYTSFPTLQTLGFTKEVLPSYLTKNVGEVIKNFKSNIENYKEARDFFYKNKTSNLSVFLRYGLLSAKELFNIMKKMNASEEEVDSFIRELFWREFYNYILFCNPKSEFENFKGITIKWRNNKEEFKAWCEGKTGVPIIDASMQHFNKMGTMHNRLRMIVASYLTKNLLIDWKWGEKYFASKLLDYEASSNIGSWQWASSTGADSVPYFRIFNPYLQSKKFDKDAIFIKSVLKNLGNIDSRLMHIENGIQNNSSINYPKQLVSIKFSRQRAIDEFKRANQHK